MTRNHFQLSQEVQLNHHFNAEINTFWDKNAQVDNFFGVDNKKIHTVAIKTGNDKAIVISQGRCESVLKYKEVAYDLNRLGYDIFLIDHRGQGFSERLGGDQNRAHVEKFQYYVDDFNRYIVSLNLQEHYQQRHLVSHSMGGTIAALYLQQYHHPFQASVFFSPMFSINLGRMPKTFAKIVTYSYSKISSWFNDKPCYVFSGKRYKKPLFADNYVTSSKTRFLSSINTYEQSPQTQLGSPTMHWVNESISAASQAIDNANRISIPLLIVQAGADTVVNSSGQEQFIKNASHCKNNQLLNITGAKHEILLESDQYRTPALKRAIEFLNNHEVN